MAKQWTLRELAAKTGVPERTIRFYISRELLDPPLRGGRGAVYGERHRARLEEIRKLQAKGMMLAEIAHALALPRSSRTEICSFNESGPYLGETFRLNRLRLPDDGAAAGAAILVRDDALTPLPEAVAWRAYAVAADAVIMLKAEAGPWRTKRLLAALRRFAAEIKDETKKEDKGE